MNQNEVIGKWAVEKGLLDCWHERDSPFDHGCMKCGEPLGITIFNPNYSIYENIAPVLDKLKEEDVATWGWDGYYITFRNWKTAMLISRKALYDSTDLPTTLLDMVAELISKGEV